MIRIEASRAVAAPPDEVYALLLDPLRFDQLAGVSAGTVRSDEELPDRRRVLLAETQLPSNRATVRTETVFAERVENERLVIRHRTAPTLAGIAPWLRLGRVEAERVIALAADGGGGTLVRVESGWRYRPFPLHLYFAFVNRAALQAASERSLEHLDEAVLAARA